MSYSFTNPNRDRNYGDSLFFWMNELKRDRKITEDESKSLRSKEVSSDEMITKVTLLFRLPSKDT